MTDRYLGGLASYLDLLQRNESLTKLRFVLTLLREALLYVREACMMTVYNAARTCVSMSTNGRTIVQFVLL